MRFVYLNICGWYLYLKGGWVSPSQFSLILFTPFLIVFSWSLKTRFSRSNSLMDWFAFWRPTTCVCISPINWRGVSQCMSSGKSWPVLSTVALLVIVAFTTFVDSASYNEKIFCMMFCMQYHLKLRNNHQIWLEPR